MPEHSNTNYYVALAENLADCQAILKWHLSHRQVKIKVIALSLSALVFFENKLNIDVIHVWRIADMESIIDNSYWQAIALCEKIASASPKKDLLAGMASQSRLQIEFFIHSFSSVMLSEKLAELFKKNNWTYLAAPLKMVFLGPYYPNNQKNNDQNYVFKTTIRQALANQKIRIKQISRTDSIKIKVLPLYLSFRILIVAYNDFVSYLKSIILRRPTLKTQLKRIKRDNYAIFASGWGRDLVRMLTFSKFAEEARKRKLTCLNVVWRLGKFEKELKKVKEDDSFLVIHARERIIKGVSYGPDIGLFGPRFLIKLFVNFFKFSQNKNYANLDEIFNYQGLKINFFYNIFFIKRLSFITGELMDRILRKIEFKYFIGSDSGGAVARTEIIKAKQYKIITLSTPHGYLMNAMPDFFYLADKILTYGKTLAEILEKSAIIQERIKIIGSSFIESRTPKTINKEKTKIIIGTRSWCGLWSSFASRQNLYHEQFMGLIKTFANDNNFSVIIKSHPNGDFAEYYEQIVKNKRSNNIQYVGKGWREDTFYDFCDILICLGEYPSLFIYALLLQIPIIFIKGTMTKTQHKMLYPIFNDVILADNYQQAYEEAKKIATDSVYYSQILSKQNKLAEKYISSRNSEANLVELIKP